MTANFYSPTNEDITYYFDVNMYFHIDTNDAKNLFDEFLKRHHVSLDDYKPITITYGTGGLTYEIEHMRKIVLDGKDTISCTINKSNVHAHDGNHTLNENGILVDFDFDELAYAFASVALGFSYKIHGGNLRGRLVEVDYSTTGDDIIDSVFLNLIDASVSKDEFYGRYWEN